MGSKQSANTIAKTAKIYFQTHWDREWYQPFRAYQVRLAEVVDAIIDRVESGLIPCFMLDGQTVLLDDYLELRPWNRPRLENLIKSQKLKIGPWFVMPDEFLISGESLLRNLKYGILSSRQYGQQDSFCGYLPDTFGHSADIPGILTLVGINNAIVWRGVSPKHSEFYWQSPNGEKVLAYFLADGYFQMMMHLKSEDPDLGDIGKAGALLKLNDKLSERSNAGEYLLPIGGDHLGPLGMNELKELKAILPDAAITTPDVFLAELGETLKNAQLIEGELTDQKEAFLLPGVYSSRMYLKQRNRQLEHALTYKWEPLQVLARRLTNLHVFQNELQTAWHELMLNHPHDSICGCSVDSVHQHNEIRFNEVEDLFTAVTNRLKHQILEHVEPEHSKAQRWIAINTLGIPYTGVIPVSCLQSDESLLAQKNQTIRILQDDYLADMMQVPLSHKTIEKSQGWIWVENVAPLSCQVINANNLPDKPKHASAFSKSKAATLENEFYKVETQKDGTLAITDKQSGTLITNAHHWRGMAQQGDSYNAAPVPGSPVETATLDSVEPWHEGPLVAGVTLNLSIKAGHAKARQTYPITSRIWLEAGSPLLYFESTYTNQTPDWLLQVGFGTSEPIQEVEAESHFSIVKRHYDPDYDIQSVMPVPSWTELKTNTGPIQRFIRCNQQAFFTEGMAEYEVSGANLYLTFLRAFGLLSKGDTGVRGAQAGPPFETPEGQCLGRPVTLRYAWSFLPQATQADLSHLAQRFYGSITALPTGAEQEQTNQLVAWDNPNVIYTACYLPGNSSDLDNAPSQIVLRLLNQSAENQTLMFISQKFTSYQLANGLDEAIAEPQSLQTPLQFSAYELKTLLLA